MRRMKRIQIRHATRYRYSEPVRLGPHVLRIRPRSGHDIRIESAGLTLSPQGVVKWHRDIFGNSVAVVRFDEPTTALEIRSDVVVRHFESEPLDFLVDESALHYPFHFSPDERIEVIPYQMLCFPDDGPVVREWLQAFWSPGRLIETYVLLDRLNRAIAGDLDYRMREEPGVQSPAQTLRQGSGSCRDFATLFIEACRHLGLAGRFVSGYLNCPASTEGHGSTHAWSEVYLPGAGWKGFDNTSGALVGHDHIAAAVSRHPAAVPPVEGSFTGPEGVTGAMEVTVEVNEV